MRWLGRNPRAFGLYASVWTLLGFVVMVWSIWWGLLLVALGAANGMVSYLGLRRDRAQGR